MDKFSPIKDRVCTRRNVVGDPCHRKARYLYKGKPICGSHKPWDKKERLKVVKILRESLKEKLQGYSKEDILAEAGFYLDSGIQEAYDDLMDTCPKLTKTQALQFIKESIKVKVDSL